MRGRKPKPTELKILTGNPGKRPLNKQEPKPQVIDLAVSMPDDLTHDEQLEWSSWVPVLNGCKIITELDVPILRQLVQLIVTNREANKKLRATGLLIKTPGGYAQANPLLSIINQTNAAILARLVELGMTPSSRSRLKVESPGKNKSAAEVKDVRAERLGRLLGE
jgi:P27 family predicted phage terminase small subunit